jgi:hypothetical protein
VICIDMNRRPESGTVTVKGAAPAWDTPSLDRVRGSLSELATLGMPQAKFGKKGEVDPVARSSPRRAQRSRAN